MREGNLVPTEPILMPLRLQKKATRVVRAVVEEVNVARGVGTRTDKRGNAKTSLWDHGKVRACVRLDWMFFVLLRLTRDSVRG